MHACLYLNPLRDMYTAGGAVMKKTIGYVLSHTHWDREWYLSFQLFRMRLVDMLDTLISYLEQHPEFPHFHLDGQTVCLEDYLEVRPDQAERLRHLIEAGRIAVGPWYVLPDLQCRDVSKALPPEVFLR